MNQLRRAQLFGPRNGAGLEQVPPKASFPRLSRMHFQSALEQKEPERRISVKRLHLTILTNLRNNHK
jgi:hypothetical protein